jgi:hypothetical protein
MICRISRIGYYAQGSLYFRYQRRNVLPKGSSRHYTNPTPPIQRKTAAAIIIGDEILNGTTLDTNTQVLAQFLFSKGIEFKKAEIVPDQVSSHLKFTYFIYKIFLTGLNDLRKSQSSIV